MEMKYIFEESEYFRMLSLKIELILSRERANCAGVGKKLSPSFESLSFLQFLKAITL